MLFRSFNTFKVSDAFTQSELTETVKTTFTNLKESSDNGFAGFSTSSSATNSSFTYRVAFSFPKSGSLETFYSLVTTIQLHADIEHETSWWGLSSSTKKNFSATITGLELEVTNGFVAPKAS